MTAVIVFLGTHALLVSWLFVACVAAVCLIVAWINRPLWMRRIEESLRRRFRGAI